MEGGTPLGAYQPKYELVHKDDFKRTTDGIVNDLSDQSQLIHLAITASFEEEEVRRYNRGVNRTLLVIVVAIVVFNIIYRTSMLRMLFPESFAWYEGSRLHVSFPPALGEHSAYTMQDAAVAYKYPAYASLLTFAFRRVAMSQGGCEFLLLMTEYFGDDRELRDVHWAGSSVQLGLAQITTFLPPHAQSMGEVYHQWLHPHNVWRTLFPTYTSFAGSEAVKDWVFEGKRRDNPLWGLFQGGLVEVAFNHMTTYDNGRTMVAYLLGEAARVKRPGCSIVTRAAKGFDTFSLSMMIGSIVLSFLPVPAAGVVAKTVMPQVAVVIKGVAVTSRVAAGAARASQFAFKVLKTQRNVIGALGGSAIAGVASAALMEC